MKKVHIIVLLAIMLFCSCDGTRKSADAADGVTAEMKYADLLTLMECDGYVYAQIKNPWDSVGVLHSYVLVERDKDLPKDLPEGDIIRIPLSNSVVYTSVHNSLLNEIGAYSAIKGVCDLKYIDIKKLQADVKAGKIVDLGEGTNPNIEAIIDLSPDAILLSPFQNSGSYGRLGKLGIPIVECADYMETSALGRAEWMRFYGLLYGRAEVADSLFDAISTDYLDIKMLVAKEEKKPTVITDFKFGASWYVPGGNSTVGRLLADAGADYIFKDRPESGSVPLDPEVVFDAAIDAEFWVAKYSQATDKTYSEISQDYGNYSKMAAFKNKNIYTCNTTSVPFYEETPFHPNRLLKDYVKIFHPELLSDYQLRYFKKVCEK